MREQLFKLVQSKLNHSQEIITIFLSIKIAQSALLKNIFYYIA